VCYNKVINTGHADYLQKLQQAGELAEVYATYIFIAAIAARGFASEIDPSPLSLQAFLYLLLGWIAKT